MFGRRQMLHSSSKDAQRTVNELQVGQFHFGTWEKHRAGLLEAHFWACE